MEPELELSLKTAKKVGAGSTLTDDKLGLLKDIANDEWRLCDKPAEADIWDPLAKGFPKPTLSTIRIEEAKRLAWIFTRDPLSASKVIIAAHKKTASLISKGIWQTRYVIRKICSMNSRREFDVQRISEDAELKFGRKVSIGTIRIAIELERAAQKNAQADVVLLSKKKK